jgi:hypothetical protein
MDIIGLILGCATALTFAYLITQVIVRLTAEPERPELFPFGDFVNLPEEVRAAARKGRGEGAATSSDPARNSDVRTHRDEGYTA